MEKKNKWAWNIALSALGYFRMVLTICSLIAWVEREWFGLLLIIVCYGISTIFINKVLDYPSNETIKELTKVVKDLRD